MRHKQRILWVLATFWLLSRLALGGASVRVAGGIEVLVLDHGYHSGIVVKRGALERFSGAVGKGWLRDFPQADWFEIGWGDRGFYSSVPSFSDATVVIAANALLWPSESVLHVATGLGDAKQVFGGSDQISLLLADDNARALIAALEAGSASGQPMGEGLYLDSLFYPGAGQYYLFFTCNSWVAAVLRQADVGASPLFAQFTKGLFWELRLRYNLAVDP